MKKIIYFIFFLFIISCKNDKETIVKGNIPNLPDGIIYLHQDYDDNKIDSAVTKNGVFEIKHIFEKDSEPVFLGLTHMDNKGVKRLFNFTTQAKYKGVAGWGTGLFLSDSLILINGKIKENIIPSLNLPSNIKLVNSPPIIAGKQTEAYYHIDGDLFEKIDEETIPIIQDKIKNYPYSYDILYNIIENKNSFTAAQEAGFLESFKGEITESESYKKLLAYNQKRFSKSEIPLSQLESINGKKSEILDKKFKKHLIVFWASWCGPCRAEIPLLKKAFSSKNPNTEFISISTDDDKNAWKKAVNEEQMSWKQFILNKNTPAYENYQIRLKLNGAIPYSVLVDNNLKIITSTVGLSTLDEIRTFINKN